jgi:hypothetical protein
MFDVVLAKFMHFWVQIYFTGFESPKASACVMRSSAVIDKLKQSEVNLSTAPLFIPPIIIVGIHHLKSTQTVQPKYGDSWCLS